MDILNSLLRGRVTLFLFYFKPTLKPFLLNGLAEALHDFCVLFQKTPNPTENLKLINRLVKTIIFKQSHGSAAWFLLSGFKKLQFQL